MIYISFICIYIIGIFGWFGEGGGSGCGGGARWGVGVVVGAGGGW